jgi:hypothetical protein
LFSLPSGILWRTHIVRRRFFAGSSASESALARRLQALQEAPAARSGEMKTATRRWPFEILILTGVMTSHIPCKLIEPDPFDSRARPFD